MAEIIIPIIGAIVGNAAISGTVLGLTGAQIGFMAGSIIAAYAFPRKLPTQVGPRIDDRKVQSSTYGIPRAKVWGYVRVSGNVIWAADLEEVETATEYGGKGGGGGTQITYSYYGTFAVSIAEGPLHGVRKIWADQILIYDATPGPDNLASSTTTLDFVFYPGSEDQLPDPTMEAALGVGNTPAYRGESYMVFNRIPLELYGNRLPSISVEVTGTGEYNDVEGTSFGDTNPAVWADAVYTDEGNIIAVADLGTTMQLSLINPTTGVIEESITHPITVSSDSIVYVPPLGEVWVACWEFFARFDATTLAFIANTIEYPWSVFGSGTFAFYDPRRGRVYAAKASSIGTPSFCSYALDGNPGVFVRIDTDPEDIHWDYETGSTGISWSTNLVGGGENVCVSRGSPDIAVLSLDLADSTGSSLVGSQDLAPGEGAIPVWDSDRRRYVVFTNGDRAFTITDETTPVITEVAMAAPYTLGVPHDITYMAGLGVFALWSNADLTLVDAATLETLEVRTNVTTEVVTRAFQDPNDPGNAILLGLTQMWSALIFSETVGNVVADLCEASGLVNDTSPVTTQYDVSALTQRLRGLLWAEVGPARTVIEQLAAVYAFDMIEADGEMLAVRRGGDSVAVITLDECIPTAEEQDFAISTIRAQEYDLPKDLALTASDPARDYQPSTQLAERRTGQAGQNVTLSVGTVLSSTEAVQVAMRLLWTAWAERERLQWKTTRKYARLVPTDVITLNGRRIRINTRSDEGAEISWEGVGDIAAIVNQYALGVDSDFPGQFVVTVVPTDFIVLDTALLREGDNTAGAYGVAWGVPPQWRGAVVSRSADGGESWSRVATFAAPGAAAGTAINALGDWDGANVFDEANSLTVSLNAGSAPSSASRLSLYNGSNVMALSAGDGWEILQYRDAILNGDGTYTFSGLLRGRLGTEWAMGVHDPNDRVVLLNATTVRTIDIASALLGVQLQFRAVSIGGNLDSTPDDINTIEGIRLKPLSPCHLGGGRNTPGDVKLKWVRRTRIGGEWRDSVDASLGETSEEYVVEIFTNSARTTVVRTVTGLTSPTTTYTAAQQTSDFGGVQSTVYWRVYQLSSVFGRGYGADGVT
jgi:hypothetical protein